MYYNNRKDGVRVENSRDIYEKYYISEERKNELLKKATIVYDTSALLEIYSYSEGTKNIIINSVFDYFKGRLWIPAQVKFEYLKNRERVIKDSISSYQNLIKKLKANKPGGYITKLLDMSGSIISSNLKDIKNELENLESITKEQEKHPYMDENIYSNINGAISSLEDECKRFKESVRDLKKDFDKVIQKKEEIINNSIINDEVLKSINQKIQVGSEYEYDELMEIVKEGKFRYDNMIPPGYSDLDNKKGLDAYGDLILWKQILQYAKQEQTPILFVCNDCKEDWIVDKERRIPRFELLKEFNSSANQPFWIYSFAELLDNVKDKCHIDEKTIKEVKSHQYYEYIKNGNKFFKEAVLELMKDGLNLKLDTTNTSEEFQCTNLEYFDFIDKIETIDKRNIIIGVEIKKHLSVSMINSLANRVDSIVDKYKSDEGCDIFLFYLCTDFDSYDKFSRTINDYSMLIRDKVYITFGYYDNEFSNIPDAIFTWLLGCKH